MNCDFSITEQNVNKCFSVNHIHDFLYYQDCYRKKYLKGAGDTKLKYGNLTKTLTFNNDSDSYRVTVICHYFQITTNFRVAPVKPDRKEFKCIFGKCNW